MDSPSSNRLRSHIPNDETPAEPFVGFGEGAAIHVDPPPASPWSQNRPARLETETPVTGPLYWRVIVICSAALWWGIIAGLVFATGPGRLPRLLLALIVAPAAVQLGRLGGPAPWRRIIRRYRLARSHGR